MLRHQVIVLRRKFPHPQLTSLDRLGLLVAAAVLPTWRRALAIVQPETLLRWHRKGFRMFWRLRSRSGNLERRVATETVSDSRSRREVRSHLRPRCQGRGHARDQIKTAIRTPNMNPVGESLVGSLRREALEHVLLVGEQKLEDVARQYLLFNKARPHQVIQRAA